MARLAGDRSAPEGAQLATPELAGSGLLEVAPPAFLDALVKARAGDVLAVYRTQTRCPTQVEQLAGAAGRRQRPQVAPGVAPGRIGAAEGWVYALGFLAYGAQVAEGVARLIWRAMAG